MADEPQNTDAEETGEEEGAKKSGSPIPFLVVGALGVGLGMAVPFLLPPGDADVPDKKPIIPAKPDYVEEISEKDAVYIPFDEEPVIVNINDERLTRFLSIQFSMKIAQTSETTFTELLGKKKTPLKSWLITHLSRYTLEDLRGPAGQHRIKREILDECNSVLFPDGGDRIFAIMYTQFAVQ